jgi:hypothetical protein
MGRFVAVLLLCAAATSVVQAQNQSIKPMRVPAGSVLTFYLQTRLNSSDSRNAVDLLPRGTQLAVKILEPIDSATNRDGSEFRGFVTVPVASPAGVVIHADAEVKGLFALLRSKSHPDGFRYELLITEINDSGRSFRLTASLNASFLDVPGQPSSKGNVPSKAAGPIAENADASVHR